MNITPITDAVEAETKRFPIMHTVTDNCPECGHKATMNHETLEYPVINGENSLYMYCDECDHDWTKTIIVTVGITEA